MPIYEYKCESCGKIDEILMKFSDPNPVGCTTCGGSVHKLISQSSFALKGSGWYVTDYGGRHAGMFDDTKSPDYKARCEGTAPECAKSSTESSASESTTAAPTPATSSSASSPAAAP